MQESEVNGYTIKVDKAKSKVIILFCGQIIETLDIVISRVVDGVWTASLVKRGNVIKSFENIDIEGVSSRVLQAACEYVKEY